MGITGMDYEYNTKIMGSVVYTLNPECLIGVNAADDWRQRLAASWHLGIVDSLGIADSNIMLCDVRPSTVR